MAKVTVDLILAIRRTAQKLEQSNAYQWGHMGSCNCGFLAQEVTQLTKAEIHRSAMQSHGDWSEQLNDYCPTSGLPLDNIITKLINFGFDREDLKHLERLSDPLVLGVLPREIKINFNVKSDVVLYLKLWAGLLEESILASIDLRKLEINVGLEQESEAQIK
jgi:hypothetical protein